MKFNYYLIFSLVFLSSIIISPVFSAQEYYADIDISVDRSGFVTISGDTNYEDLIVADTQIYTFKDKSFWLLNISIEENFSDYVYTVSLPEGALVNHIGSSGFFTISEKNSRLLVNGFGEDSNLSIIIQYKLEKNQVETSSNDLDFNLFLIFIIFFLCILFILIYYKYPDGKKAPINKFDEKYLKGLNSRQKKIMKILIENNSPMTQKDIQDEVGIPKASISRNIKRLELKGLIEKEKAGMSNIIKLKK